MTIDIATVYKSIGPARADSIAFSCTHVVTIRERKARYSGSIIIRMVHIGQYIIYHTRREEDNNNTTINSTTNHELKQMNSTEVLPARDTHYQEYLFGTTITQTNVSNQIQRRNQEEEGHLLVICRAVRLGTVYMHAVPMARQQL